MITFPVPGRCSFPIRTVLTGKLYKLAVMFQGLISHYVELAITIMKCILESTACYQVPLTLPHSSQSRLIS